MTNYILEHKGFIFVALIIFGLSIYRGFNIFNLVNTSSNTILPEPERKEPTYFFIEVFGGVNKPGVYQVSDNTLVVDAIKIAGGFSDNADLFNVEKSIPFSKRVYSEMKIYIPFLSKLSSHEDEKEFNINYATKEELIDVKGIGEITALKIIEMRPFTSWADFESRVSIRSDVLVELQKYAYF
jgi:competence protein ComEA